MGESGFQTGLRVRRMRALLFVFKTMKILILLLYFKESFKFKSVWLNIGGHIFCGNSFAERIDRRDHDKGVYGAVDFAEKLPRSRRSIERVVGQYESHI